MTKRFTTAALLLALVLPGVAAAQFSDSYNFIKAVRDKDGVKVMQIINKPGSVIVDTRDGATGETALHIVTKRRDAPWLNFLLVRGAKPETRDGSGNTPMTLAAQLGWVEGVQTLLSFRANVDSTNSSGATPLILAVQNRDMAMVRVLLATGANTKRPDNAAGLSAIEYARRDPRATLILKELETAKPVVARPIAGPK